MIYCGGERKWYPENQFQPYPDSQGRLAHMVAIVEYRHYADNGDWLVPPPIPGAEALIDDFNGFLEQNSKEGSETDDG